MKTSLSVLKLLANMKTTVKVYKYCLFFRNGVFTDNKKLERLGNIFMQMQMLKTEVIGNQHKTVIGLNYCVQAIKICEL